MTTEGGNAGSTADVPVRVLVVSRDAVYARTLADRLRAAGMSVVRLEPGSSVGENSTGNDIDVVLVETHGLVDAEWMLVERLRERSPLTEIVAVSSDPLVATAVEALRHGAIAILPYPVSDEDLASAVTRAYARKRRGEERLRVLNGQGEWKRRTG